MSAAVTRDGAAGTVSDVSLATVLYSVFFCSIVFSQLTISDAVRVSVPIKELACILLVFQIATARFRIPKSVSFIAPALLLLTLSVTFLNLVLDYGRSVGGIPFTLIAPYVALYSIGAVATQATGNLETACKRFRIGANLLYWNSYIALALYFAFFLGLNPLKLGINDATIFRAFGLTPEPSHFSIFSTVALSIRIYFTYGVAFYADTRRNRVAIAMLALAVVLSFSPTGFVFAATVTIFALLQTGRRGIKLLLIAAGAALVLQWSADLSIVERNIDRLTFDFDLLVAALGDMSSVEVVDQPDYSRVARFLSVLSSLSRLSAWNLLFGLGLGGQALHLGSLDLFFPGPVYVLVECGLLGLAFLALLVMRLYPRGLRQFWPLLFAYVAISFFNPPGGIFGAQFLVLCFFILNAGTVYASMRKESHIWRRRPGEFS